MRFELEAWKEYIVIVCILIFALIQFVWAFLAKEPVTERSENVSVRE